MKWNVTAVSMNRSTRRLLPMPKDPCKYRELIDTKTNKLFTGCNKPILVEQTYEGFWNNLNPNSSTIVKVINVERA